VLACDFQDDSLHKTTKQTKATTHAKAKKREMEASLAFLAGAPMCVVVLDGEGKAVGCNDTFEAHMGPLYKFANTVFDDGACGSEESKRLLGNALHAVRRGVESKVSVKDVQMITLEGAAGLPVRRHFDWSVGKTTTAGGSLILMGEPCSERTMVGGWGGVLRKRIVKIPPEFIPTQKCSPKSVTV
jgi:hypothetical protein